MYAPTAAGACEREYQQDQPGGRDEFAEQQVPGRAVVGGGCRGGQGEHQVREHRPADPAGDLGGKVERDRARVRRAVAAASEEVVGEGDHGVEVRAGQGREDQDDDGEAERGGGGVLQQLQPGVGGREALGHDPGADDEGDEQPGAEELGERAAGWMRVHGGSPPRFGGRGPSLLGVDDGSAWPGDGPGALDARLYLNKN